MSDTVVEIFARPGTTTVFATSAGGSGVAAASYAATQVAGYLHRITVAEALVGAWYFGAGNAAGDDGFRKVDDLTDTAETFSAISPTLDEISAAAGDIDQAVLAASIAAQLQLAAVRREGEAGPVISDRTVYRGTTWRIALPFDLPVDWTRVEFTARVETSDDQAASLLHVVVSNPSDADGLKIFNGSATGFAAGDASISTDGSPVVILAAELAAKSPTGSFHYDAKVWNPDGVDQSVRGTLFVEADVTRSPLAA